MALAVGIDNMLAGGPRPVVSAYKTVGTIGTPIFGGMIVTNEKNPVLAGRQKYQTYSELLANVAIVAAGVRYFLQLVAKAGWKVVADEKGGAEAEQRAELVESMMGDMETSWFRVVRRSAMYRFYGFSIQEWTAKRRQDGNIGMADIQSRPQHTIDGWDVESSGRLRGVVQESVFDYSRVYLPREKIVYAVDDSITDSPEGVGLMRHIVDAGSRLRQYEKLEGFGFETDLRGIPIARGPFALLQQLLIDGKISEEEKNKIEAPLKLFIQNHIRTPQLGVLLDSMPYLSQDEAASPSAIPQWDLELLKGQHQGLDFVNTTIERLIREIARVLGVETLLVGQEGAGSMALSRDKSNNLAILVDSTLTELAEVMRRDFVRPIYLLNGWDLETMPKFQPDATQYRDVEQVTAAIRDLATSGAMLDPEDPCIDEIRALVGLSKHIPFDVNLGSGDRGGAPVDRGQLLNQRNNSDKDKVEP